MGEPGSGIAEYFERTDPTIAVHDAVDPAAATARQSSIAWLLKPDMPLRKNPQNPSGATIVANSRVTANACSLQFVGAEERCLVHEWIHTACLQS